MTMEPCFLSTNGSKSPFVSLIGHHTVSTDIDVRTVNHQNPLSTKRPLRFNSRSRGTVVVFAAPHCAPDKGRKRASLWILWQPKYGQRITRYCKSIQEKRDEKSQYIVAITWFVKTCLVPYHVPFQFSFAPQAPDLRPFFGTRS